MRSVYVMSAFCMGITAVFPYSTALAWEGEVNAETLAQVYNVTGAPGTPTIYASRVTQTLSLAVHEHWARTSANGRRGSGIRLSLRARLRLDADFGFACQPLINRCLDETNSRNSNEFQPLFARRSLDLPYAYLDVSGILNDLLDVRVGRMFSVDSLGFFLLDGARLRGHIGPWFVLEAYGGLEARSGFALTNGRFERDGLIRADRTEWDSSIAPYVQQRVMAPVFGAAVETPSGWPVFGRVVYRRVWTDLGVSEEKLGTEVNATIPSIRVRLSGSLVYSFPHQTVANASLTVSYSAPRVFRFQAGFQRYRPVFDPTSIWSVFWTDATDELHALGEWIANEHLQITAQSYVRRYALSDSGYGASGVDIADRWNVGGQMSMGWTYPSFTTQIRGNIEGGGVGLRTGVDLSSSYWLVATVFRLEARLSLWHVMDELRPSRNGPSFAAVIGGTVRLGPYGDLNVNAEDDINALVGHRLRLMAVLHFRGWM